MLGSGGMISVCFNQHQPFEERDSWCHLFQARMGTQISSLYLHVRTEFVEVAVPVFFHFLWSVNGQRSVGVYGYHHAANVCLLNENQNITEDLSF